MKIGFRCEYKTLYARPEGMSAPVRRSPVKARSRIPFDSGNRVQKKTFPESNTAFQERSYKKWLTKVPTKNISDIINLYPAYYIYSSKQQISYSPYEFCMIFIQQFCPLINNDYKLSNILTRHHKKRQIRGSAFSHLVKLHTTFYCEITLSIVSVLIIEPSLTFFTLTMIRVNIRPL